MKRRSFFGLLGGAVVAPTTITLKAQALGKTDSPAEVSALARRTFQWETHPDEIAELSRLFWRVPLVPYEPSKSPHNA